MKKNENKLFEQEFNGKKFPYREVYHKPANGKILVATESLIREFDQVGWNEEAEAMDTKFYCYVDDDVLQSMSQSELENYIAEHFD